MNPVVHFEMPYEDKNRLVDFYTKAFGWQARILGAEMGEYVTVSTSETGDDGFPTKPGRINGGFYKKTAEYPEPSVVISVDDIRDAIKKVEAAGGTIIKGETNGEPVEIPGIGQYVGIVDSEGNRVGVLQPSPM